MSPTDAPPFQDDVLPWLAARRAAGAKAALVTLVGVDGASPRPLGAQMAVDETGAWVGLVSGGCVEAAIAQEALAALAAGENRLVRYGAGSPYLDIRLPCGSGIDVYVDARLPDAVAETLVARRAARRPAALHTDLQTGHSEAVDADGPTRRVETAFTRRYLPAPRLLLFGAHPVAAALGAFAAAAEIETARVEAHDAATAAADADAWTGAVLLYHDHVDEPAILDALLDRPLFFLGALGSRATHKERCAALVARGRSAADVARIQGPVGAPIGAATPPEIAVSILAAVIAAWRETREPR